MPIIGYRANPHSKAMTTQRSYKFWYVHNLSRGERMSKWRISTITKIAFSYLADASRRILDRAKAAKMELNSGNSDSLRIKSLIFLLISKGFAKNTQRFVHMPRHKSLQKWNLHNQECPPDQISHTIFKHYIIYDQFILRTCFLVFLKLHHDRERHRSS